MKIKINYLLGASVAALLVLCFLSVYSPIRFKKARETREEAVKERLIKIRSAEEAYRKAHGTYCGNFATLIREGYLADSLQYIPYVKGRRFALKATTLGQPHSPQVPVMECGASYAEYLKGLDQQEIDDLMEHAIISGDYPGLKIGDITIPNNNAGNWE